MLWMQHLLSRLVLVLAAMLSASLLVPALRGPKRADAQPNKRKQQLPVDPIVLTPIVWSPIASPVYPVRGTDGRIHLAYELLLTNVAPAPVRLTSLEAVDPLRKNAVIGANRIITIKDAEITNKFRPFALPVDPLEEATFTTELQPGRSAVLWLSFTIADSQAVPEVIKHRATLALTDASGKSVAVTGIGGVVEVSREEAIVLSPPLKGDGWVNQNGCCATLSPHRSALLPTNVTLRGPERFAIDFIRIDAQGRSLVGDPKNLASWHFYGAEVIAAAGGKVVEAINNLPNQVPGKFPTDITPVTAIGNHVIIDIGEGRYALYAHLIPESVAVRVGEVVRTGQLLGRLGNSGNSDAPHLHFQVMDRPAALDANGLPFVFDQMRLQGRTLPNIFALEAALFSGGVVKIDTSMAGPRTKEMPLNQDILSFK